MCIVKQTQLQKVPDSLTAVSGHLQCQKRHICHVLTSTFKNQDTNKQCNAHVLKKCTKGKYLF